MARDKEILDKYGISRVVNAAADYCQSCIESVTYLDLHLKDHSSENIECVFYEVAQFLEEAKLKGEKVLVHCVQGVSRSVSLIVSYLILTQGMDYDQAISAVTKKREIASPNIGFIVQLQYFYKRLFEVSSDDRLNPKVFAIGYFQAEQRDLVVRLVLC